MTTERLGTRLLRTAFSRTVDVVLTLHPIALESQGITPNESHTPFTAPLSNHTAMQRSHKMTSASHETTLKPEQLQSVTICANAIFNIAKDTGRKPIEIWQLNETELGKYPKPVTYHKELCAYRVLMGIAIVVLIILTGFIELSHEELSKALFTTGALTLVFLSTLAAIIKMSFIPHVTKSLTGLLGLFLTIISTLLGFYDKLKEIWKYILTAMIGMSPYIIFCLATCTCLWISWKIKTNEAVLKKEQLATVRATLPLLLASPCEHNSTAQTAKHLTKNNSQLSKLAKLTAAVTTTLVLLRTIRPLILQKKPIED